MHHDSRRHRNAEVDFKGEKRSNATHASVTDPDARLYKKSPGAGAVLCTMANVPVPSSEVNRISRLPSGPEYLDAGTNSVL